ncbi:hypothetical protein CEP54_000186 [Fusarium duplospermum]|uniref:Uncharacterized protein n=1 Tax=Fusarium duplospermum TaxID=1325734 RepID=A0A428R8G7_9HYPO|nr:hypothetical protein CEP54_000186 [Fusarium duplospermum]
MICGPSITTIEEAAKMFITSKDIFRPNVLFFLETVAMAGSAFALGQGLSNARASRERTERISHTGTTIASMMLKGAKPGEMRREDLQLHIFNCLALITAYPVCVLNRIRGNTYDFRVVSRCNQAAKRLQQLRPIERDDTESESMTDASGVTVEEGTTNEMEHFFEMLSLELELEFRTSFSRSGLPSLAHQRVMYNIRNHLDDLTDFYHLGEIRPALIRENIDMMAAAGRDCGIPAFRDNLNPIAFLRIVDTATRIVCLSIPVQTCTTLAWSMMTRVAFEIGGISIITATALTILDEMWSLWDPYAKGINAYAWTLGIAREIDSMLNDVYDSDWDKDKGLPLRKHGYNVSEMRTHSPRSPRTYEATRESG